MKAVPTPCRDARPCLLTFLCVVLLALTIVPPPTPAAPVISEFMTDNVSVKVRGFSETPDWIEIHNPDPKPVNLGGWHLSDDEENLTKWSFPEGTTLEPGAFMLFLAMGEPPPPENDVDHPRGFPRNPRSVQGRVNPDRQLNFKLDPDGEFLALIASDGKTVVDSYSPEYPKQRRDTAYGIPLLGTPQQKPQGERGPLLFPTPGKPNTIRALGECAPIVFSRTRGHMDEPFTLQMSCQTPGAKIHYTLDGSMPSIDHGQVYSSPIRITKTTVLRTLATKAGYFPGSPATHTYLFPTDVIRQPARPKGYPRSSVNGQRLRFGMLQELVDGFYTPDDIIKSLRSLPALCVSTDKDNLFGASRGIYVNARQKGIRWERPASLELIPIDGTAGFQIDAGLRVRGGFSRHSRNPKHALRAVFRRQYGAGKLRYPVFGKEGAKEFDHLDFRTSLNYSWASEGNPNNTILRDVFSRDTQRDMGQPYTRSRFYHLFLNGLYWGVYQSQERSVASYASTYMGGKPEDYDVIKTHGQIPDGNPDAHLRYHSIISRGVNDKAEYMKLQGRNPDGSRQPEFERFLDAENLMDYMIITYYTGDRDGPGSRYTASPNNFYAVYNRTNPDGWKYFEHDSEHSLDTGDEDMTFPFKPLRRPQQFNPHWLHDQLVKNNAYLADFRARVDKHFEPDGALSLEKARARLEKRVGELAPAIPAHACRWGSSNNTHETWETAVDEIRDWMENRTEIVYEQLRNRGWYPGPKSPKISLTGRAVPSGQALFLTAQDESDEILYTLDGTDPRNANGQPSASARRLRSSKAKIDVALRERSPVRALVPTKPSPNQWWLPGFDDTNWIKGQSPVGYERRSGYESIIRLNLDGRMGELGGSVYLRYVFNREKSPSKNEHWRLRVKFDDAFSAWLNGQEIASFNAPDPLRWNSFARRDHKDSAAQNFLDFPVTDVSLIQAGRNVLAVQGMDGAASSDFLIGVQLERVSYSGGDSITVKRPVTVSARCRNGDLWSSLLRESYVLRQ